MVSATNEAQLIEQMQRATEAPDPGLRRGEVVSQGDGMPSIVSSIGSAGYVYIWDTRTGERSVTNKNMLPSQLKKVREDGSRVFTVTDPHIKVKRGTLKCMLHKDDANRKHYDELGFATCPKSNLPNLFQVRQHMQHRHKDEWKAIEQERAEREKEEEREFQRKLLMGAKGRG